MSATLEDILDPKEDPRDMGKTRTLKTETCIITFKCQDPFGFWTVHVDKGQLPGYLKGNYTTFDYALKDVNRWLNEKRLTVIAKSDNEDLKPIDRTSVIPEFKYKKKREDAPTGD